MTQRTSTRVLAITEKGDGGKKKKSSNQDKVFKRTNKAQAKSLGFLFSGGIFCYRHPPVWMRVVSAAMAGIFFWQQVAWAERLEWWEQQKPDEVILGQANPSWEAVAQGVAAAQQLIADNTGVVNPLEETSPAGSEDESVVVEHKLFSPVVPIDVSKVIELINVVLRDVLTPWNPDMNHDGVVDIGDLVKLAQQFGQQGLAGGKLKGDLTGDGVVDIVDLVKISSQFFGKEVMVVEVEGGPQVWVWDSKAKGEVLAIGALKGVLQQWMVGSFERAGIGNSSVDSVVFTVNLTGHQQAVRFVVGIEKKTHKPLVNVVVEASDSTPMTPLYQVVAALGRVILKKERKESIPSQDAEWVQWGQTWAGMSDAVKEQVIEIVRREIPELKVNHLPVVEAQYGPSVIEEGKWVTFKLIGTDPDGEEVLFRLAKVEGAAAVPLDPKLKEPKSSGSVWTWVAASQEIADSSHPRQEVRFIFEVSDDGGKSWQVATTLSITVVDTAPLLPPTLEVLSATSVQDEGKEIKINLRGTDANQDKLQYRYSVVSSGDAEKVKGAQFDSTNGILSWVVSKEIASRADPSHKVTFRFEVSDDGGKNWYSAKEVTITINDVNRLPVIQKAEVDLHGMEGGALEGGVVSLKVFGEDPDGDQLTFRLKEIQGADRSLFDGKMFEPKAGGYYWTMTVNPGIATATDPRKELKFVFEASDDGGKSWYPATTLSLIVTNGPFFDPKPENPSPAKPILSKPTTFNGTLESKQSLEVHFTTESGAAHEVQVKKDGVLVTAGVTWNSVMGKVWIANPSVGRYEMIVTAIKGGQKTSSDPLPVDVISIKTDQPPKPEQPPKDPPVIQPMKEWTDLAGNRYQRMANGAMEIKTKNGTLTVTQENGKLIFTDSGGKKVNFDLSTGQQVSDLANQLGAPLENLQKNNDETVSFSVALPGIGTAVVDRDKLLQLVSGQAVRVNFSADGKLTSMEVTQTEGTYTIKNQKVVKFVSQEGIISELDEVSGWIGVYKEKDSLIHLYDLKGRYIGFIVRGQAPLTVLNPVIEDGKLKPSPQTELVFADGKISLEQFVQAMNQSGDISIGVVKDGVLQLRDPAGTIVSVKVNEKKVIPTQAGKKIEVELQRVANGKIEIVLRWSQEGAVLEKRFSEEGKPLSLVTPLGKISFDGEGRWQAIEVSGNESISLNYVQENGSVTEIHAIGNGVEEIYDAQGDLIGAKGKGFFIGGIQVNEQGQYVGGVVSQENGGSNLLLGEAGQFLTTANGMKVELDKNLRPARSIDPKTGIETRFSFENGADGKIQFVITEVGLEVTQEGGTKVVVKEKRKFTLAGRLVEFEAQDGTRSVYDANGSIQLIEKPGAYRIANPQFKDGKPWNFKKEMTDGNIQEYREGKPYQGAWRVRDAAWGKEVELEQVWEAGILTRVKLIGHQEIAELVDVVLGTAGELEAFTARMKSGIQQRYVNNEIVWKRLANGIMVYYKDRLVDRIALPNGETLTNVVVRYEGEKAILDQFDWEHAGMKIKYNSGKLTYTLPTGQEWEYRLEGDRRIDLTFRDTFDDGNTDGWRKRGGGDGQWIQAGGDLLYKHKASGDILLTGENFHGVQEVSIVFKYVWPGQFSHVYFYWDFQPGIRYGFINTADRGVGTWLIEFNGHNPENVRGGTQPLEVGRTYQLVFKQEGDRAKVAIYDITEVPFGGEAKVVGGGELESGAGQPAGSIGISGGPGEVLFSRVDVRFKPEGYVDPQVVAAEQILKDQQVLSEGVVMPEQAHLVNQMMFPILEFTTELVLPNGELMEYEGGVARRHSADGKLLEVRGADGSRVVMAEGRISQIVDGHGNVLTSYQYDESGDLAGLDTGGAQARIRQGTAGIQARLDAWKDGELAVLDRSLARAKEKVTSQVAQVRTNLANYRSQEIARIRAESGYTGEMSDSALAQAIQSEPNAEIKVRLERARKDLAKVEALVSSKEAEVHRLEQEATEIKELEKRLQQQKEQVLRVWTDEKAKLVQQEQTAIADFVKQEQGALGRFYTQQILGRQATDAELEELAKNPKTIEELKKMLFESGEYKERKDLMAAVTNRVSEALRSGTVPVVGGLSPTEVAGIEQYLRDQSLHFGSSAFVPMGEMLAAVGVNLSQKDLAVEAILADIALGNITGATKGDLQISLEALWQVAASHGKELFAVKMTVENLAVAATPFIAHLAGNHYVLVTEVKDGVVTYKDPTVGEKGTVFKETTGDFAKKWTGYALAQEKPKEGAGRVLSAAEAKTIKGAFFGLIFAVVGMILGAVAMIAAAIAAAVIAVAGVVSAFVGAVTGAIGGAISAIGAGISAMIPIPVIGNVIGGTISFLGTAITTAGNALASFGTNLLSNLANPFSALSQGNLVQTALGGVKDFAVQLGVSKGLDAVGVEGGANRILSSLISGGIGGGLKGAATAATVQGTRELGAKAGLPTAVTEVLSWGAGAVTSSALQNGIPMKDAAGNVMKDKNGNVLMRPADLGERVAAGLKDAAPTLGKELAVAGLTTIAQKQGVNQEWLTVGSATIRGLMNGVAGIGDGLKQGLSALGIAEGAQRLEPKLGAVGAAGVMLVGSAIVADGLGGGGTRAPPGTEANQNRVATSINKTVTDILSLGGLQKDPKTGEIISTRGNPVGEAIYQSRLSDLVQKAKTVGVGQTVEQYVAQTLLGGATQNAKEVVDILEGKARKVLIDGKKPATERVLDENNKVIIADDGSETILNLGNGDYTVRMKYNAGQFEAVQLFNKGRVLTPAEMAFVMEQLGISAGRLLEITPAQRQQDQIQFKEFTNEVEAQLTQKLGTEKAKAVVNDLKQAGEKLINDPSQAKQVKTELQQKPSSTKLTKEEWGSASQILQGVAEKFKDAGLKIDAGGNTVGGFLTYFAGEGIEFFGDPLKFGEGIGKATVAAEQGHYGEAALYVLQDGLRLASLVPGVAMVTKSVNRGLGEAITAGKVAEPVAGNVANRFAQAWRNLWNPLEKTYQTSNGILRNTTKEIQFFDDLGNLKGAIGKQTTAGAVRGEASVAEDAVKLLREGKATSQQVAEMANGKLVNKDIVVSQTLGGIKTELNSGGKINELANVLRETDGIQGADKLFSGEIKTVRHYIRTKESVDAIKAAGKLDPTKTDTGKIFVTIQDLNATEAENFLALRSKPVAYIDVPIERLKGKIDVVRKVEPTAVNNGNGIEIATLSEINISDLKIINLE